MPRPRTERQAIEEELAELPAQVAAHRAALAATPLGHRLTRERLDWFIRRDEKRTKDLQARLAALPLEQ